MEKEVTVEGNMAIIELMQEEIEEERRKTIIPRSYRKKVRKNNREYLKRLTEKIEFLKRSKTFGSVEVIMESTEESKLKIINQI